MELTSTDAGYIGMLHEACVEIEKGSNANFIAAQFIFEFIQTVIEVECTKFEDINYIKTILYLLNDLKVMQCDLDDQEVVNHVIKFLIVNGGNLPSANQDTSGNSFH